MSVNRDSLFFRFVNRVRDPPVRPSFYCNVYFCRKKTSLMKELNRHLKILMLSAKKGSYWRIRRKGDEQSLCFF